MIYNTIAHTLLSRPSHMFPHKHRRARKNNPPIYPKDRELDVFHEQHKLLPHLYWLIKRNQTEYVDL